MGYYSMFYGGEFQSDFSLEEIKKRYQEFIKKEQEETIKKDEIGADTLPLFLSEYDFDEYSPGHFEVVMDEYYMKHYQDGRLAKFISTVIKPGTFCQIRLVGEDFEMWGYHIEHGAVYELDIKFQKGGLMYNTLEAVPSN